ncbi:MAG: EamA family transporter [Verrucomicrobiota bacterium]|nr:EamA family transporter [Verrucomicrobiota bacterium]
MSHLFTLVPLLLITMVSIQSGAAFAKQLFPAVGVISAAFLRLFFAALTLLLLFRPWKKRLTLANLPMVALYGLSLGSMNMLCYLAMQRLPLGIAVAIEFIGPLAVAISSLRKKIDLLWILLALLGLLFLLPIKTDQESLDPIGILYALASALFWALYIIFGKRARTSISTSQLVPLGVTIASLIIFPFFLLTGEKENLVIPSNLLSGAAIGVCSSALPCFLETFVMKSLSLTTFGILMSLEPVVAALFGLFLLDEQLSLFQWAAIGSIIFASIGTSLRIPKKQEKIDLEAHESAKN